MTPYRRTLDAFRKFARSVRYPDEKLLTEFAVGDVRAGSNFSLQKLYQRTAAANKLGWDVHLRADETTFTAHYVKRPDFGGTGA